MSTNQKFQTDVMTFCVLSFFSLSLTHFELSIKMTPFPLFARFPSDPHGRTRTREKRSRRGWWRRRAHAAREITLDETSAGRRVEPGEYFPGLIKIRNDLFPGCDPFSPHRSRRLRPPALDSYFHPGIRFRPRSSRPATESITCSF